MDKTITFNDPSESAKRLINMSMIYHQDDIDASVHNGETLYKNVLALCELIDNKNLKIIAQIKEWEKHLNETIIVHCD